MKTRSTAAGLLRTTTVTVAVLLVCRILTPGAAVSPRELIQNFKSKSYTGDRIQVVIDGQSLSEILGEFESISGLTFTLDPSLERLAYLPRRYNFQGYPWDRALDTVLTDAGLGLRLEGNVLWVEPFTPEKDRTVSAFVIGTITAAALGLGIFLILTRRRSRRRAANRERKITLDSKTVENVVDRLNSMFRVEKIYRDERLSLDSLSERLGYQPHQLSGIVNSRLGKSFTQLVADYRVEEAMRRLSDPGEQANILSIACDAGFRTKASFNRIFKARTGLTPSEYRRKHSPGS